MAGRNYNPKRYTTRSSYSKPIFNTHYPKPQGTKPFDTGQYDQDDNAKELVIQFLESKFFKAWVNPDKYGIDVLATKNGLNCRFEVEVKHNWETMNFPFDTVHFSARKLKFVDEYTWFVMLNSPRTHALFVPGEKILAAPIITKDTKFTTAEQFVSVSKADCEFRTLIQSYDPYNS